jgi:hypothetical protein
VQNSNPNRAISVRQSVGRSLWMLRSTALSEPSAK